MSKPTKIALALAAALAIALAAHWPSSSSTSPSGASARLALPSYSPLPGVSIAVELAGFPADAAAASMFVVASAPPNAPGDFVELYAGTYDGKPIYFNASGKLGELAKGWVNAYRARGSDVEGLETGLIVFVSVYNKTALSEGRVQIYQTTADVVSYKPAEVIAGKSVLYIASVDRGRHGFARIAKQEVKRPIPVKPADGAEARLSFGPPVNPEIEADCDLVAAGEHGAIYECWKRVYYLGVENLTSALPADYFSKFNGKLYMKTPVLILYNRYWYSGVVSASIDLEQTEPKVGVYVTFQAGPQLGAVFKGESAYLPSVTVWKSELFAWGGQRYYGGFEPVAAPNEWRWGYFWGRPAMAIYEHYWIFVSFWIHVERDSNDYAVYAITDFYVVNNKIQGKVVSGKPDDKLMNMLFQGSTETYVGALRPGDSIRFAEIFSKLDEKCGADFEVGIPVGSIVAALFTRNPLAVTLASGIGVSISAEGGSAYIRGGVSNNGIVGNTGYNVTEYIYIRVSNYTYVQGSCKYDVPIGIYIDSR